MSRTYSRRTCPICQKELSANGLAYTNHMRKHVREGTVLEYLDDARMYAFTKPTMTYVSHGLCRDGGSVAITTSKGLYYLDRRIGTKTPNRVTVGPAPAREANPADATTIRHIMKEKGL